MLRLFFLLHRDQLNVASSRGEEGCNNETAVVSNTDQHLTSVRCHPHTHTHTRQQFQFLIKCRENSRDGTNKWSPCVESLNSSRCCALAEERKKRLCYKDQKTFFKIKAFKMKTSLHCFTNTDAERSSGRFCFVGSAKRRRETKRWCKLTGRLRVSRHHS